MTEDRTFHTLGAAFQFMTDTIDRRADHRTADLGDGLELRVFTHSFDGGAFTNVYDLSWSPAGSRAELNLSAQPASALDRVQGAAAMSSAGFFVLANKMSGKPRHSSLNLVIEQGRILSLPVVDRQAVLSAQGALTTEFVRAEGELALNGVELTWTGSRTDRTAQTYVYGNGNLAIGREADPATGSRRVLREDSRYTPPIPVGGRWVDIGFHAAEDGSFRAAATSSTGRLDIFAHDVVVRCREEQVDLRQELRMEVLRAGSLRAGALPDHAISAGPSLASASFNDHEINRDPSFGDPPPFTDERRARMVLFHGSDDRTHLRLFDGRPGSPDFQGASPTEARDAIVADTGYQWGCFLDGGGTAKIWVVEDGELRSYGNRHYLRWPERDDEPFVWTPDTGRPTASSIVIRPAREVAREESLEGREQRLDPALAETARLGLQTDVSSPKPGSTPSPSERPVLQRSTARDTPRQR